MFVNIANSVRNFSQFKYSCTRQPIAVAVVVGRRLQHCLVQIDDVALLEVLLKLVEQLQLLFGLETVNHIEQLLRRGGTNEAGNVYVYECCHQELTVETIHDATVSGDHVTKVLNLECSLKS